MSAITFPNYLFRDPSTASKFPVLSLSLLPLIPVTLLQQCHLCFLLFYMQLLSVVSPSCGSPSPPTFAGNSIQQTPQCSTSVSCSSPSKQPSQPPSVWLNTAPGPSFPLPKNPVWADCISPTSFLVSQSLNFLSCSSLGQRKERGRGHCSENIANKDLSAVVMFADMYGRVKARLMAAGESSQKSKSS